MSFWAYMLHCRGGQFYVGHTDDLERRIGQHQSGLIAGFTADHQPVELVWSDSFQTRDDAKAAERKLKGWSRAKKLALIHGDWEVISALAKKKGSASTSSAQTGEETKVSPRSDRPELVEGPHFSLQPHPKTPSNAVRSVQVEIARGEFNELVAVFKACSDHDAILVPPPVRYASRRDGLWQTTCFEVFIMLPGSEGYLEFNFSPSTGWAGYSFKSYRSGVSSVEVDPPHFDVDISREVLMVTVVLDAGVLGGLDLDAPWQIALSAVIEETGGHKSYWALAHPPGKPDFHHPTCFAATLAAPSEP